MNLVQSVILGLVLIAERRCGTSAADKLPAACFMEKIVGPCDSAYKRYYFDHKAGECRWFYYSGCKGNDNNFRYLADCQEECADVCALPKKIGPCEGALSRYFFNKETGSCERFDYGGCEGNANRFTSKSKCVDRCVSVCELPKVVGPCEAAIRSYFFNKETGSCEMFTYGGCDGNANRFNSKSACEKACPSACTLPSERGSCTDYEIRWHYDGAEEKCVPFIYGGCGGNDNNFMTEEMCMLRCPVKSPCALPKDVGHGEEELERYYYNTDTKNCLYFEYRGKGGNGNNFKSPKECSLICPVKSPCVEPRDYGVCDEDTNARKRLRWYFDVSTQRCRSFLFSGCGGNGNRFYSRAECQDKCNGCSQEKFPGVCRGKFTKWYYDTVSENCKTFTYGGCGGNFNNFDDEWQCRNNCY